MPRFPNLHPSELLEAARRFALAVPSVAPALARRSDDAITELLVGGLATAAATVLDRVKDIQRPAYEVLADRSCPWLRRPIPASTIVAFAPPSLGRYVVHVSAELRSSPVDGVACRFRPIRDVVVSAFQAESAQLELRRGRPTVFRFVLRSTGNEPINEAASQGMALYVDGDRETALDVLFALTAEATRITVEGGAGTAVLDVDPSRVTRAELDAASALAPDPDGPPATFHTFIEAAVCPDKFRFFCLPEMPGLRAATPTHRVTVSFHLGETSLLEARIRPGDIRAHCTPMVNLFEAAAEPVPIDTEHPARPLRVAGLPRRGGGIYSVRSGVATARDGEHPPVPLPDVRRLTAAPADPRCPIVFATSAEERDDGDPDIAVTFGERAGLATPDATRRVAAFRVIATNRALASRVRVGDLTGELETESGAARYVNLTPASPYVPPPTGDALRLRVLRAARITEGARDPLGALQDALFQAIPSWLGREEWVRAQHLRIRALDQLEVAPARRLDPDGAVRRGYGYRVVVDEAAFRGPGDLALLGATLGSAFARAVPVGTFAELRLEGRRGTFAGTFGAPGKS